MFIHIKYARYVSKVAAVETTGSHGNNVFALSVLFTSTTSV